MSRIHGYPGWLENKVHPVNPLIQGIILSSPLEQVCPCKTSGKGGQGGFILIVPTLPFLPSERNLTTPALWATPSSVWRRGCTPGPHTFQGFNPF
jgi:hypothetical protein